MIKKGSKVLILELNKEHIGFKKLYHESMIEYVDTEAEVLVRKTKQGSVKVLTEDSQVRHFLREDLKVL